MQLINMSTKVIGTSYGSVYPGRTSSKLSRERKQLVDVLKAVTRWYGPKIALKLDDEELSLLSKVTEMHKRGMAFNPNDIPSEVRNDPTGAKRNDQRIHEAHSRHIVDLQKSAMEAQRREDLINGEIADRKPVGYATMAGDKVTPDALKSGFEKILEENARIASGKESRRFDEREALDPIGAHMKEPDNPEDDMATYPPAQPAVAGTDTEAAVEGVPEPEALGHSELDVKAAELARQLSEIGPAKKRTGRRSKASQEK